MNATGIDAELDRIVRAVRERDAAVSVAELEALFEPPIAHRTLQLRMAHLVEIGRLRREGRGRGTRYVVAKGNGEAIGEAQATSASLTVAESAIPLSNEARGLLEQVRRPLGERKPIGYDPRLLDDYVPNETFWLDAGTRASLASLGAVGPGAQPAGTYARHILDRLLIDLSWNSCRLEGNTYSRLDTRRLIAFGAAADGKARFEAQMILNHKAAIEFLVESAADIDPDRHTVANLHALLADNLLSDPDAPGRLRRMSVTIGGSVFHPLDVPQLIEERFGQLLGTAAAIEDPFERSLFVLAQLPYLQPFDDVNKRTSRLAANIPFIRANLVPLSFVDVPRETYTAALLGVYERLDISALRELFVWAYTRSCERYAAVRQSLGEPDPFRLRHRETLSELIGGIVRDALGRSDALVRMRAHAREHVPARERQRFVTMAETELLGLHAGNIARHRLRPSEFAAWQAHWTIDPS